MTQDNALRLVVCIAAVVLLTLLQTGPVNAGRLHRGRQALLPVLAAVYAAAGTAALCIFFVRLQRFCAAVTWTVLPFLPARPLQWVQGLEAQVFAGSAAVLNVMLMAGFLLCKCVLCPILSAQWKERRLMEAVSAGFYEFDEFYQEWFLKKRWADYRRILRAFSLCGSVLCGGLLGTIWCAGVSSPLWIAAFPCAALLVLNEVWCFANGQTREEYLHAFQGDESDARRVGSFYRIREIYEKLFAPQLLASHTGCEFSEKMGATVLLKSLEDSQDPVERTVARYYNTCGRNIAFDMDCIQATSRLMHGRSVVFFDPFYRDIGVYLTLPLVNSLLKGRRCLVVAGRASVAQDAALWLAELLQDYSHLRSMWRVAALNREPPQCEVGVLSFPQLYDMDVLEANRDFFGESGFVLLLEPSVMVSTGQVGLSIITEEVGRYGDPPVYCICDRGVDGLVDTMSHLLRTEITDVAAMPVPRCIYTGMAWNADGDFIRQRLFEKQMRYLGNGVELAAAAVKNQIPQVTWFGETKAPLRDLKWIAGQQYAPICRYMNLPTQQESLYEKIKFVPSLWCTPSTAEQFLLVEDEFCNLFGMMRVFLSRGSTQAFVNVLSENYLLRDYMRCNQQLFRTNPNAVPSLAPAYAKTERNTLIKLIIRMAMSPVAGSEAAAELRLAGCAGEEDTLAALSRLLEKYTAADGTILEVSAVSEDTGALAGRQAEYYAISRKNFDTWFAGSLKNAYYIVEDEKQEFVDGKMFGHICQTILPGQFLVCQGKYYQVRSIAPDTGIVLRRAADLYTGRKHYRQLRTYRFSGPLDGEVLYARKTMGVEILITACSFSVTTSGYLDMEDCSDLRRARVVDLSGDPSVRSFDRSYRSKRVLCIRLPDTDQKLRFTLSLLLSEVFRSVFPDVWQYLAVLSVQPDDIGGMLSHMVYRLENVPDEGFLYIVEDSELDLGLLDAVNRSLPQLLEIIADFLDWHFAKMREPDREDPAPAAIHLPEEEKHRSRFLRLADRLRRFFTGKPEKVDIHSPASGEQESGKPEPVPVGAPERASRPPEEAGGTEAADFEEAPRPESAWPGEGSARPEDGLDAGADAGLADLDGADIFETEGAPDEALWLEDQFSAIGIPPIRSSRYQQECFLKFGFGEIDKRLKLDELRRYLHVRGLSDHALTRARKRQPMDGTELDCETVNHCDFCGKPLSQVSYEKLTDGRIRCNDCSASAINTVEAMKEIFFQVLEMMEMFFGAAIHAPVSVQTADARTVAKAAGQIFKPSTQVSARVLGYARKRRGKYSLVIENGSPRLAVINTMAHELTHIWQYLNWDAYQVRRIYAMNEPRCSQVANDILYEGMAVWASIQYLYQIGEGYYAAQQEAQMRARDDVYGIGFRLYCEQYPLVKDLALIKSSPFSAFPTLEIDDVKKAVRGQCTQEECSC